MKFHELKVSNNPNLNEEDCPLPLSVIPNYVGVNLCSVESVAWTSQEDGQLVSLSVKFIPEPAEPSAALPREQLLTMVEAELMSCEGRSKIGEHGLEDTIDTLREVIKYLEQ